MNLYPIASDATSLAVTEVGGHLSDVTFQLPGGKAVRPMHVAPWAGEDVPGEPPVIAILRGDFFCAPFGANDVVGGEAHGASANAHWTRQDSEPGKVTAVLDETVLGATLTKQISVRPGQTMVYERHTFSGGEGRLPVAHHAMLRATGGLRLGFAPRRFAATPPDVVEVPPVGRSLLAYPQELADLTHARTAAGGTVDLTTYPTEAGYEDLWMLSSEADLPFAWTAATCTSENWVWFSFKNPRVLPSTVIWMSNGGRSVAPWSNRHAGVIGLEEGCTYFHLGHAASIADNPLAAKGVATAIALRPESRVAISYAFGLAPVPSDFGAVADIRPVDGGVVLADRQGHEVFAACDLSFVTD